MMKQKVFIVLLAFAVIMVAGYGISSANVNGSCQNCHTMHNSQDGSPMAQDETGSATTSVYAHLTRSSCIGCHNGQGLALATAPNVFANGTTENILAGGSFSSAYATSGSMAHTPSTDAASLIAAETALTGTTPGSDTAESYAGIPVGSAQLTCAGATGCHGDHTQTGSDAGIETFHHGSTAYRFLQFYNGTATDIVGAGSDDWEETLISTGGASGTHNVYQAGDGTGDDADNSGISTLCSMCHGDFHGTADVGTVATVWTRHPTDVNLSELTAGGFVVDPVSSPFGFSDAATRSTTAAYDANGAQVVCVSCHRAHGSNVNDILRFDYVGVMNAGDGTNQGGCENCHANQR